LPVGRPRSFTKMGRSVVGSPVPVLLQVPAPKCMPMTAAAAVMWE